MNFLISSCPDIMGALHWFEDKEKRDELVIQSKLAARTINPGCTIEGDTADDGTDIA